MALEPLFSLCCFEGFILKSNDPIGLGGTAV